MARDGSTCERSRNAATNTSDGKKGRVRGRGVDRQRAAVRGWGPGEGAVCLGQASPRRPGGLFRER